MSGYLHSGQAQENLTEHLEGFAVWEKIVLGETEIKHQIRPFWCHALGFRNGLHVLSAK